MKIETIVFLLVIIFLVVIPSAFKYLRLRKQLSETDGGKVTINDIPLLVRKLTDTGIDGSFWVLLIPNTHENPAELANLQMSIENGTVGLDWVLNSEANDRDKTKFQDIVSEFGLTAKDLTMNDINYLRVEGVDDYVDLCNAVLTKFYDINDSLEMELIISDFEW